MGKTERCRKMLQRKVCRQRNAGKVRQFKRQANVMYRKQYKCYARCGGVVGEVCGVNNRQWQSAGPRSQPGVSVQLTVRGNAGSRRTGHATQAAGGKANVKRG